MKRIVHTLLALVMCLSLAACASSNSAASDNTAVEALTVAIAHDIGDINLNSYNGSTVAQGMIFEGLIENTADGPQPSLAESWDISDDGTVYTFHLRKGVTFTDGEPFNAEAVKLNIEAVQRNSTIHSWMGLCGKIVSCDVVDDYTFKLVLSGAYYPTLTELGLTRPYRMMSPKSFIDGETMNGVSYYAGTGAYKLDKTVADQYATFSANENYWGGAPAIKTVTLKVMPAGETTLLAFKNGEINFLFGTDETGMIDADSLAALAKDSKYQVKFSDPCATTLLVTNSQQDRLIADKNIKQAVWCAINRDDLCNFVFAGLKTPAQTLFDKTVPYCDVELETRNYDVDKAKSLVEASGWTMDDKTGYYTKDGKTLSLEFLYSSSLATNKTIGEFIQANLKQAGVEIKLIPVEDDTFYSMKQAGAFDLSLYTSWGLPYDPQSSLSSLFSSSANLSAASGLASYDKLHDEVSKAQVTTDETQRQAYYTSILQTVHEECPFIPLAYSRISIATIAELKGVSFSLTQYEIPFKAFH